MKMTMMSAAILLIFAFLAAPLCADEKCSFILNNTSKIGAAELRPGEYKLVVDSGKVLLTDLKSGTSIELKGKIETAVEKFSRTEVHTNRVGETSQIFEIRIGGSKTKVAFD